VSKQKTWALVKNLQFLSNPRETWWKWLPHELIILTKFHWDWTETVDLLLTEKFLVCALFMHHPLLGSATFAVVFRHFFCPKINEITSSFIFFSLLFSQNKEDFDFRVKNLTRQHAENKDAKKNQLHFWWCTIAKNYKIAMRCSRRSICVHHVRAR